MCRRWFVVCLAAGFAAAAMHPTATGLDGVPPRPTGAAAASSPVAAEKTDNKSSSTGRFREGSKLIDQLGEFQKSGDRFKFYSKDGPGLTLHVLENLALERVVRVLDDNPSLRNWSVSGMITEFRGENHLLLTRAILKARTDSGVPAAAAVAPKAE